MWTRAEPPHGGAPILNPFFWVITRQRQGDAWTEWNQKQHRLHISHIQYTKWSTRESAGISHGALFLARCYLIMDFLYRAFCSLVENEPHFTGYGQKNPRLRGEILGSSISGTLFSIPRCYRCHQGEGIITPITKMTRVHVHECALVVALVEMHNTNLGQALVLFKHTVFFLFKHTCFTLPLGERKS